MSYSDIQWPAVDKSGIGGVDFRTCIVPEKDILETKSHLTDYPLQIAEVKNYFSNHKKDLENNYEKIKQSKPSTARDGPAFLFSAHTAATDTDLRAEVPSKSAVDKLVTRYFNSYDPAVHILHSPTFHKQLQAHWQDPNKTSIVWLGLLYSLLCLAMQSYHKIGDEPLEWKGKQYFLRFPMISQLTNARPNT